MRNLSQTLVLGVLALLIVIYLAYAGINNGASPIQDPRPVVDTLEKEVHTLESQNELLRKRIYALEKENEYLKQRVKDQISLTEIY
ncbi:MAG: hypothetical protein HC874_14330 [Richelia sp. SL_2_1]|nr:hypothetical protein [Richelia sp. SL_2_1]